MKKTTILSYKLISLKNSQMGLNFTKEEIVMEIYNRKPKEKFKEDSNMYHLDKETHLKKGEKMN